MSPLAFAYADLRPLARRSLVLAHLPTVLGALPAPAGTAAIADALAEVLASVGVSVAGRKAQAQLGRDLIHVAPNVPEASPSSVTFKRYGVEMRAWVWSPRPGAYAQPEQKGSAAPSPPLLEPPAAPPLLSAREEAEAAEAAFKSRDPEGYAEFQKSLGEPEGEW